MNLALVASTMKEVKAAMVYSQDYMLNIDLSHSLKPNNLLHAPFGA
jgi:hypothetical protein